MTDATASQVVEAQLALARVVVPIVVIGSALLALLIASCICGLCCGLRQPYPASRVGISTRS
jgi:hypothetical protein